MLKVLRAIGYILIVLYCAYVGASIGTREAERTDAGGHVPWQNLSLPEGRLAKNFVVGNGPALGVRTVEGALFVRSLVPSENQGWVQGNEGDLVAAPGSESFFARCNPGAPLIQSDWVPDPPGEVRTTVDCEHRPHAEAVDFTRYVIFSDGSVWRWGLSRGMASGFTYPLLFLGLGALGLVGGGIVGFVLVIVLDLSLRLILRISGVPRSRRR